MTSVQKICPSCLRAFDAHPAAIYCSINCVQRAKRRRRTQRASYKALSPDDSPNQAEYVNISAEDLARVYADIVIHVFEKDIKLIGTIPPNVPKPGVILPTSRNYDAPRGPSKMNTGHHDCRQFALHRRRLFNEEEKPAPKMLYAAALRGLREEIKSRQAEHHDLQVLRQDVNWEEHYNSLLKK
jgi:hypothetical protein